MHGGADLHGEGPERLHRLALHLGLEALEPVGVVGELMERDVGAVIAEELSGGITLHGNDGAGRRLNRDAIVRHLAIEHRCQLDEGTVAGGATAEVPQGISVTCCAVDGVPQVNVVQVKAVPMISAESEVLRIAFLPRCRSVVGASILASPFFWRTPFAA